MRRLRFRCIQKKRSIILQQSCNYIVGNKKENEYHNNTNKIGEINWNNHRIKINWIISKSRVFYIENLTKDSENNENNKNERF